MALLCSALWAITLQTSTALAAGYESYINSSFSPTFPMCTGSHVRVAFPVDRLLVPIGFAIIICLMHDAYILVSNCRC